MSLRSFVPGDPPAIFKFATTTIARFMTWEPAPSLSAFAEIARNWLPLMEAGTDLFLVVRLASTRDFMGVVGLHGIGGLEPEIGI